MYDKNYCHTFSDPIPPLERDVLYGRPHIAVPLPPLWNRLPPALRKLSDPSYELTKSPPLAISLHSSFTPSLKLCSSTNPILIHPLLPTYRVYLPVSTPNTIHYTCDCLPVWLSESDQLPIDFIFGQAPVNMLVPGRDFVFVGAVEISSLGLRFSKIALLIALFHGPDWQLKTHLFSRARVGSASE